jgi:two-component system, LytTR family, sensor histidine kinase NatK
MKVNKLLLYWMALGLLGFLHLHLLLGGIVPFYISLLLAIGGVWLLSKKVLVQIAGIDHVWNIILVILQLAVLLLAFVKIPIWISILPLLLFIGLELIRNGLAASVADFTRNMTKHEEQIEQFNETFRVVRSERHDFLKHISAIHFMLEKDQAEEAKNYLDKLVESYEETNLSIRGESGIVAGVLHQTYLRGKKTEVEVVYDLDIPLSSLPLPQQKIVMLIGNLLSNSLDACEQWQKQSGKQASVIVEFYKRSGLFILQIKNNSLSIPASILDELFHSYGKTTKGGTHEGLGTKIIMDIVEEYYGFLDFVHKDEEFEVKIKIPAISR